MFPTLLSLDARGLITRSLRDSSISGSRKCVRTTRLFLPATYLFIFLLPIILLYYGGSFADRKRVVIYFRIKVNSEL